MGPTGLDRWVAAPKTKPELTWRDLLKLWSLIETDLHQWFGVDLGDPDVLATRTWIWFRRRVEALQAIPPTWTPDGRPVQATRLGRHLHPTEPPRPRAAPGRR